MYIWMHVYDSQVTRGMKSYSLNMLQQALSLLFLLVSHILYFLPVSTANSNIYVQCSNLSFTPMTPLESNINSLLTSLVDSAPFYNFNKFEISPQSDNGVYGLFQCRGNLNNLNCKDCVASAIAQLKAACPTSIGGRIQLEACFVKYENTSFFGVQEKMEMWKRCGPSIGYTSDVLNRIDGALAYLVSGNGQYFYEGEFGSIQGLAQCVEDLSLSDCHDCLSEACGRLKFECQSSTWGDMYLGKCYIRYTDQGNENLAINGNSNSNKSSDEWSKNNIVKWVLIIMGILISTGALSLSFTNCCNINVYYKKIKKLKRDFRETVSELDEAKSQVKVAMEIAEKAEKEVEDVSRKLEESLSSINNIYSDSDYHFCK